MSAGVEVAICTFNGIERLPAVFKALAAQTLSPELWSVLIVDNGSTDGTGDRAAAIWTFTEVPFRVVVEPRPGIHMARQRAMAETQRDFICFCDDDNMLAPDYLEQAYGLLNAVPKAGAVGGQGFPVSDRPLPSWFSEVAGGYALGPQAKSEGQVADSRGFIYGAGITIRCAAWAPITGVGFEPRLSSRSGSGLNSGEDNEICLMLRLTGWEVHYSPRLKFRHLISARKLEESYCRALYRGFGEASVVLNAYRDFVLGRASISRWRLWAAGRVAQGWLCRIRTRLAPESSSAVGMVELKREMDRGFSAGCKRLSQRGGFWALYGEIARQLSSLEGRSA